MTATDAIAVISRNTARRLATPESATKLFADVEETLHRRDSDESLSQYVDVMELAGVIVSAASLAWSVYLGLRQKAPSAARQELQRSLHIELLQQDGTESELDRRVINVVIDETIGLAHRTTDDGGVS